MMSCHILINLDGYLLISLMVKAPYHLSEGSFVQFLKYFIPVKYVIPDEYLIETAIPIKSTVIFFRA